MNPLWSDILAQGSNIQHISQHLLDSERIRLDEFRLASSNLANRS
jgi:hypothetical protein